jgi:hypothetical protein
MKKLPRYQRVIRLEIQVVIASLIKGDLTQTPRHTGGGIRCLGGVSIPCWHSPWAQFHYHECRVFCCQSQCYKYCLSIGMKSVRQQMAQWKFQLLFILFGSTSWHTVLAAEYDRKDFSSWNEHLVHQNWHYISLHWKNTKQMVTSCCYFASVLLILKERKARDSRLW